MNRFYFYLWLMALVISGCEKDNQTETEIQNQKINAWILENMEVYYLWNDQIPGRSNKSLYPAEYFESLLYKEDHFSWIQDNFTELMNSLSGVNIEAGYDFNLYLLSKNSTDVMGCITYIKPGTPAEAANLKRGDYFLTINGTQITTSNFSSLIAKTAEPHSLGLAAFSGNSITGTTNVPLSVIEYKENPVFLDTIYHIQDKKIGYFVYNFFARDNDQQGISYEKELNNLFGKYQSEGIDELIVDLRYNSGGTVVTAIALASMISNRSAKDVFGYEEYNSVLDSYYANRYGKDYNVSYFLDHIERYDDNEKVVEQVPVNKLSGLERVFMIVSERSASASELVINSLIPYMGNDHVVLVGKATRGKNVGSYTIYETDPEKQKDNNWGMQPIVLKMSNSAHFSDYTSGFEPDIEIHESEELELKPLGDIDELLLSTTINRIFGVSSLSKRATARKSPDIAGSSIDRTPARKNMYVTSPNQLK